MSQQLKDILKQAHERIKGVHAAKTAAGSLGKEPGVDYQPKAGDEDDFVAKHSVEKWDDRAGNKSDVFQATNVNYTLDNELNKRLGNKEKEAMAAAFPTPKKGVSEAKEAEDAQCNHSAKGKECPVHGMAECWSAKPIKENEIDEAMSMKQKAAANRAKNPKGSYANDPHSNFDMPTHKVEVTVSKGEGEKEKKMVHIKAKDKHAAVFNAQVSHHKAGYKVHDTKHKGMVKEEALDEKLTKSTTAGETIHDFVHSKNPKFAGKSKEKRKQMALAAYYAKQNEETINEWEAAEPLLGSADIAKNKTDDTGAEIDMVRTEMKAIANKVMHLLANMPADHHIEPWVQAKIAAAKEMIGSVHDYMMYSEPQENEGTMDTPMTFPNMSVDVNGGVNV